MLASVSYISSSEFLLIKSVALAGFPSDALVEDTIPANPSVKTCERESVVDPKVYLYIAIIGQIMDEIAYMHLCTFLGFWVEFERKFLHVLVQADRMFCSATPFFI